MAYAGAHVGTYLHDRLGSDMGACREAYGVTYEVCDRGVFGARFQVGLCRVYRV